MNKTAMLVVLVLGLVLSSYVANTLYAWKAAEVPYSTRVPVQFYAGMDKFLSNVSWMTLVQWEAEANESNFTPEECDRLYKKLNTLTNLDPLFLDAYIDGALTLAPQRPDDAIKLLEKAMEMGAKGWKAPMHAGQICQQRKQDYAGAVRYMELAVADPEAPTYVLTNLLNVRCQVIDNEPLASMNIWYAELGRRPDNADFRKVCSNRLQEWRDEAVQNYDQKIKDDTDPAHRKQLLDERAQVIKIADEVRGTLPPTTAPTTMPAI